MLSEVEWRENAERMPVVSYDYSIIHPCKFV